MNLPQRPRLNRHNRCREHTRDREDRRIDDLHATASHGMIWGFLGQVVGVGLRGWDQACAADYVLCLDISGRFRAGEDEELAWWDVVPG